MNKMTIGILVTITTILGCVALYLNYPDEKPLRCDSHLIVHMTSKEGKKLVLNLSLNFIKNHEDGIDSELLAAGSLTGLSKDYVIARRIFLSMNKSDFRHLFKTIVTREKRHPIDNLPDEIWQQYVLPAAPEVEFYLEGKKINESLYLIKGLTNPYFICAIVSH